MFLILPSLSPRFIHLMVDPVFITLGCVPFILVKSLPKTAAAHTCMYSPPHYPPTATNGTNNNQTDDIWNL